jgi:serine/alanine adding enzyme
VSLREVEPAEWDSILERLGLIDVYLRRAYVETACRLEAGTPSFLHCDDVVFAAILREVPNATALDLTTAYGYGGPVAAGGRVGHFWKAYEAWCAERGVVTSFFRFHPLYENHRYADADVRLERLAGTVAWRLRAQDLLAGMDGSHRNTCRKAERAGVVVSHDAAGPVALADFAALYAETMRRRRAQAFYFFGKEYWEALEQRLGDRLVRFDARLNGELAASALCLGERPWLHYHLGASLDEARRTGATNLLLYEAARWAKENGFELFHLGGGVGGREDSLLSFKRRFDPGGVREYWIGKAVHDADAYRRLTGEDEPSVEGFFPAYRQV